MSVVYDKTYHAVTEHSTFKRRKLLSTVLNNLDRFFNELFSPKDMEGIVANTPITVVSAVALKAATVAGKALTCVSCYFGNYDVVKFIVIQQPGNVAGLYHPLNNKLIHKRYF
ncbi:MAG: lauroyl acyltransferase, partial [Octadecabacter sp.]|nr:lauroyl acyltransferase [Octadecabacter sp.]